MFATVITIRAVITRKPLHYRKTNDQLESRIIEMSSRWKNHLDS